MFRKSFAVWVAVVMVMVTGLPAFAEDEEWDIAPQLMPLLDLTAGDYFTSSENRSFLAALILSELMIDDVYSSIDTLLIEATVGSKIYEMLFFAAGCILWGREDGILFI